MKATQFLLRSPGRLVLSLLLGLLTAWLLRGEVTMLLLGKDFTGRSLPVQAALLGMTALTVALIYTVILHFYGDIMRARLKGTPAWLQTHPEITLILFFSLVVRFLADGLVDEFQLLVNPVALGGGTTLFKGLPGKVDFTLKSSRVFKSGAVMLVLEPNR